MVTSHKRALFILSAVITLNPTHKVLTGMMILLYLETDGVVLERDTTAG
jgi:hypothetical protein